MKITRAMLSIGLLCLAWPVAVVVARGQAQAPAVPRPFPGSSPAGASRPPEPAPAPVTTSTPPASQPAPVAATPTPVATGEAPPGTPIYPAAEFLEAVDAGMGQRYYIYGTNTPYAEIVTYYRNLLKNSGRELYKVPPMQQWDLGRFQEDAMAYPPSVVVKDYTWNGSAGYLQISGTTEKRFKTIIQIVPATATTTR